MKLSSRSRTELPVACMVCFACYLICAIVSLCGTSLVRINLLHNHHHHEAAITWAQGSGGVVCSNKQTKIASQHHSFNWRYRAVCCYWKLTSYNNSSCLIWPLNLIQFEKKPNATGERTTSLNYHHQTLTCSTTLRPHASVLFKVCLKSSPDCLARNSIHHSLLLLSLLL